MSADALSSNAMNASTSANETAFWPLRTPLLPKWSDLDASTSIYWQAHVTIFILLFLVVAFAAFIAPFEISARIGFKRQLIILNLFIIAFAFSRLVALCALAFESMKTNLAKFIEYVAVDLAFPYLMTAFALLHLMIKSVTQIWLIPPIISDNTALSIIFVIYTTVVVYSNYLWRTSAESRIMWYLGQSVFCAWSLYCCFSFAWGSVGLRQSVIRRSALMLSGPSTGTGQQHDTAFLNLIELGHLSEKNSSSSTGGHSLTVSFIRGFKPKIRITDENDQSMSYHSETPSTQHPTDSYHDTTRSPSPIENDPSTANSSSRKPSATSVRRSISDRVSREERSVQVDSSCLSPDPMGRLPHTLTNRSESPSQAGRSKVEEVLQRVVIVSLVNIGVCILQAITVLSSLTPFVRYAPMNGTTWLFLQTLQRFLEFLMALLMSSITTQSFAPPVQAPADLTVHNMLTRA